MSLQPSPRNTPRGMFAAVTVSGCFAAVAVLSLIGGEMATASVFVVVAIVFGCVAGLLCWRGRRK